MKKIFKKYMKNEKGMTLIELLAVIVIIAIIAAIAIPAIGNIIENSRFSAVKSDATNVVAAANIYFAENPDKVKVSTYTLKSSKYLDNAGKIAVPTTDPVATPADYVEKNANGELEITTAAILFSGNKNIKFTGATVKEITGDPVKGSAVAANATEVIGD